jgi:hypothetical protein
MSETLQPSDDPFPAEWCEEAAPSPEAWRRKPGPYDPDPEAKTFIERHLADHPSSDDSDRDPFEPDPEALEGVYEEQVAEVTVVSPTEVKTTPLTSPRPSAPRLVVRLPVARIRRHPERRPRKRMGTRRRAPRAGPRSSDDPDSEPPHRQPGCGGAP